MTSYLISGLSYLDSNLVGTPVNFAVDAAAKAFAKVTPSGNQLPAESQKALLNWTKSVGCSELKKYETLHWGPWGAPIEYAKTTALLMARRLHSFVLVATHTRGTVEELSAKITTAAEPLGGTVLAKEAFAKFVQVTLSTRTSTSTSGLTKAALGAYAIQEVGKYVGAGLLRFSIFHYVVGRRIPNIPYLYETAALAALVLGMLPLVNTARRELSQLPIPQIDAGKSLLNDATQVIIAAEAQRVFKIADSDDQKLTAFKKALEGVVTDSKLNWPFRHASFKEESKKSNADESKKSSSSSKVDAEKAERDRVRRERADLKAEAKKYPEDSQEGLMAQIAIVRHAIVNAAVLKLPEDDLNKRKGNLDTLEKKLTELLASVLPAAPEANANVSDDEG